MFEKEKLIKEQRLGEVVKRDYKGLEGKFGIILKYLGHPVISQESAHDVTEFYDPYELPDDSMPTQDFDTMSEEIGRAFDGLKFGMHLEITFLNNGTIPEFRDNRIIYAAEEKVITVSYKGTPVYVEGDNNLHIFVPGEWEKDIERVYKSALTVKKQKREEIIQEVNEETSKKKVGFLNELRRKWGI